MSSLRELFDLEPAGDDSFIGLSPEYPWGRVFGGQAVSQALWAAGQTVEDHYLPHSIHAYFIRGGDMHVPIIYSVDRIRDGRSFTTRRVVGMQNGRAIMNLSASFQIVEDGAELMPARPDHTEAPGTFPLAYGDPDWSTIYERQVFASGQPGTAAMWSRFREDLGDSPLLHAAALAYVSDDLATDAVVNLHPDRDPDREFHEQFMSTSLDHAVWFHQPTAAAGWLLHEFTCTALRNNRGMSTGQIHDADGAHIATIAQEVLLRQIRPD